MAESNILLLKFLTIKSIDHTTQATLTARQGQMDFRTPRGKPSATRQVIGPSPASAILLPLRLHHRTHVSTRPAESDNRRPTSTLSNGAEDERTRGRARWKGLVDQKREARRDALSFTSEWNCMRGIRPTRRTLTEVTLFFATFALCRFLKLHSTQSLKWDGIASASHSFLR